MDISGKKSAMQKKIIYGIILVGLTMLYVNYVPCLLDYYVARPQDSFFEFYYLHIFDEIYTFEGVILGLVLAGLYCITLNAGVTMLILSAALFILTHAGYLKYINRRELIRLDDLRLTEVAGMLSDYIRFEFSSFLLMLAGGLLAFVAAGFGAELFRRRFHAQPMQGSADSEQTNAQPAQESEQSNRVCPRWVMPAVRVLGAMISCGILVGYVHYCFASEMQWDAVDAVDPAETDSNRHVLYQFLRNDSLVSISEEDVEMSRAFLTEHGAMLLNTGGAGVSSDADTAADSTVCPNVIVIMNESWWNTDWLDASSITFSKDPMEPYKQLEAQCDSGYLTANIYGGGTVSSEAEFLTGLNTKYYVTSSGIYERTLGRKLPTVVDYFNALDYKTTAIHPYYGDFYSRNQVYPRMGFDNAIFDEDMQYRELYTRYISDDSLVSEIIAQYESAESERQFIWAVSIGNHSLTLDYYEDIVKDYDYPISVTLREELDSELEKLRLINYINGIYLANQAYARLVEYFSEREEPVILVMYGDHIPNFSQEIYDALGFATVEPGQINLLGPPAEIAATSGDEEDIMQVVRQPLSTEELSMEQSRIVYSVPVLLWSNSAAEELCCREERPSFEGESIYYLPQMLLDYAGLPDSEMTLALRYERSLFKANSRAFVLDAEGELVQQCTEEQVWGLRTMQIVEYDILFGEGLCQDIWLPLEKK